MIVACSNNGTKELYEVNKVTSKEYESFFDIHFISSTVEITISYDYNIYQDVTYTKARYNNVIANLMAHGYVDLTEADFAGWQTTITDI